MKANQHLWVVRVSPLGISQGMTAMRIRTGESVMGHGGVHGDDLGDRGDAHARGAITRLYPTRKRIPAPPAIPETGCAVR